MVEELLESDNPFRSAANLDVFAGFGTTTGVDISETETGTNPN